MGSYNTVSNFQRLLSFTKQLTSHVNQGSHDKALTLFHHMQSSLALPLDAHVFSLILKSCSALHRPQLGAAVHAHVSKSSFLSNPFVACALVDMYGKCVSAWAARREMGFDMKNTTSLWAMYALRCKNTLNRSRQVCMMRWGWSEDDFLSAFRRCPRSFLVSEKKLSQVMDFWVNKIELPSPIVKHPEVFAFSLEKRIMPRGLVFKVLLSKGLVNEDLGFLFVLKFREEQFLKMFVTKYVKQIPQLLSVYQGNLDIHDIIS